MKKFKLFVAAIAATLAMTACSGEPSATTTEQQDNYQVSILAPKGAPSLAFYDMANDEHFATVEPAKIKGEFAKSDYSMIVMEFYTGLNIVKKSNSNYRLARVLTGGNLYLVSRSGKTSEPTATDKVLAFGPGGEQGIPTLALKKLYPAIPDENITVLDDGAAVQAALISGKYGAENQEKQPVDYVVIPQPALAGALGKLKEVAPDVHPNIITSLRDKSKAVSNNEQPWVLQAGLFVHKDLYAAHRAKFDVKLANIDRNIESILDNPETVGNKINELLPSVDAQKLKFGCPAAMVSKVSKNPKTPNGFGFIRASEWKNVNIQSFLTFLGKTGAENDFSNLMLTK